MKKRKSALLLISVFAAMTLAACGDDPASPSSKPAPSSVAESSLASDSLGSSDAGSLPGSSADAPLSSQPGQSSSLPPASSSAPHVETDWVGKPFVGQYQGGFTTLMVNEDMTTSWDTDSTHHPAKYEIMPNGVYHIYSDDSVASDDKVDVYTDGTMAYVTHDAAEKDAFIVDKMAEYQAANAMAKKADGSLIIGSVAVGSKVKFFRVMNNVYEFNIKVEVGYGDSIEAAGAIFDVVVGSNSSTYRVVTAGSSASGAIAIIEDYTVIRSVYHGAAGDLVIARNGEEIVYVTLDGQDIDLENVVVDEDGNITIKDGQRTLDNSDPSHMIWVYGATKYTLDEANHAYAAEDATSNEDVFQALDLSVTQMSAVLGSDGNLWATFTPAVGGFLSINIVVGVDYYSYGGYYDDHITIFRADAASYTNTSDALISKYGSSTIGSPSLTNFEVQAGVSYVIKVGSWDDRSKALGDTGSSFAGETLTIGYSYAAFDVDTYNGAEGALVIESYNGAFRSAVLNGQALEHVNKNGNVITASAMVMDFDTDPNDPKKVTTTITITLDPANNTYVLESDVSSESVFHVLTEADSGTIYSTVVGDDGNLWAAFSPVSSGYITVDETTSTSSDGFVAIFESTAASFVSTNAVASGDYGGTASGGGKITNYMASAGKTYIIKAGNYYDRNRDLGDTGSQYSGATEAIKFEFSSILTQTFNDEMLRFLHRRHTATQALDAVRICRESGITNISIDLMYGLPGQTLDMFRADLHTALSAQVQHISSYCLSYEENTPLKALRDQGRLTTADDDLCSRMYTLMCDTLREGGFEHYEISNFCLPGFHSRHNSSYWDGTPYLGLGAGAHSYNGTSRQWNPSDLDVYMQGVEQNNPQFEVEHLSETDLYNERLMLRLRTSQGLDLFSLTPSDRLAVLESAQSLVSNGSLKLAHDRLSIPEQKLFVSDSIISSLFR